MCIPQRLELLKPSYFQEIYLTCNNSDPDKNSEDTTERERIFTFKSKNAISILIKSLFATSFIESIEVHYCLKKCCNCEDSDLCSKPDDGRLNNIIIKFSSRTIYNILARIICREVGKLNASKLSNCGEYGFKNWDGWEGDIYQYILKQDNNNLISFSINIIQNLL